MEVRHPKGQTAGLSNGANKGIRDGLRRRSLYLASLINKKVKKEEKGYEKENLFSWHWFAFGFSGIVELRPDAKNSDHKEQFVYPKRELARMDKL